VRTVTFDPSGASRHDPRFFLIVWTYNAIPGSEEEPSMSKRVEGTDTGLTLSWTPARLVPALPPDLASKLCDAGS
jgi:hypothetical protein